MLQRLGTGLFDTELMGSGVNGVTGDYSTGADQEDEGGGELNHHHLPHHPGVFVFQDVAVEHARACELLHQFDPHGFA